LNYTNKKDTIIDVGAGVSVLIDNLLDKGYKNLSINTDTPAPTSIIVSFLLV
jgi:16S rRNA A1518/A1519 N6-dimethyltransferase RsmA/KsgA/DIM1 with predicted DNA glycosylase/AP lyase activity